MANYLIFKAKKNTTGEGDPKALMVKTARDNEYVLHQSRYLGSVAGGILALMRRENAAERLVEEGYHLTNLTELIAHGFTFRLGQNERAFNIIVAKDNSSTTFVGEKRNGIASILMQAEDWAEDLIEQTASKGRTL